MIQRSIINYFMDKFSLRNFLFNDETLRRGILSSIAMTATWRWRMKIDVFRGIVRYETPWFDTLVP